MLNIFFFFLFLIKIYICSQSDNKTYDLYFNDNYTYMSKPNSSDKFLIYAGNELSIIAFEKNDGGDCIIDFGEDYINFTLFNLSNETEELYYNNKTTKVHYLSNKRRLTFMTKDKRDVFEFQGEYAIIKTSNKIYNISGINFNIFSAKGEYCLIKYYLLSYIMLFFGCFISLYGSYHYIFGLSFHSFYFLSFNLNGLISLSEESPNIPREVYILFGSFLIGITISFICKNLKPPKKYVYSAIIYGLEFGYTLFKLIIHYFLHFGGNFDSNDLNGKLKIYICVLISFIFVGALSHYFLYIIYRYNEHRLKMVYIPCSVIGGSFYLIQSIQNIIGGYFSSTLVLIRNIKIGDKFETALTYLIAHIIIIIFSTIFQIKYIKHKQMEKPGIEEIIEENSSQRNSNVESNNQAIVKDDEEPLVENKERDSSINDENNDINDQDE